MFGLGDIFSFLGRNADLIGTATQGISAIQSYMAQKKEEKATKQANAAMMQAAETEAKLAREDAAQKAEAVRRDAARFRATQIASYLKSGVTLDGTPMLVANETTTLGNKNADNIITNADYSAKSILLRAQANKQTVKKADIWGTAFKTLGSLSSFASAYDKAYPSSPKTTKTNQGGTITWF